MSVVFFLEMENAAPIYAEAPAVSATRCQVAGIAGSYDQGDTHNSLFLVM